MGREVRLPDHGSRIRLFGRRTDRSRPITRLLTNPNAGLPKFSQPEADLISQVGVGLSESGLLSFSSIGRFGFGRVASPTVVSIILSSLGPRVTRGRGSIGRVFDARARVGGSFGWNPRCRLGTTGVQKSAELADDRKPVWMGNSAETVDVSTSYMDREESSETRIETQHLERVSFHEGILAA